MNVNKYKNTNTQIFANLDPCFGHVKSLPLFLPCLQTNLFVFLNLRYNDEKLHLILMVVVMNTIIIIVIIISPGPRRNSVDNVCTRRGRLVVSEQILNDVLPRGSEDERVIQNRNENIEDFYKRSSNDMFIFLFYVTLIKRQRLFVYSRHLFTCGRGGWNSVFLWSTTRTSLDLNVDGVVRVHLFFCSFSHMR